MTLRHLGRTGVLVSPLTLGAMNFGAWANPDHDDAATIIHRALDAGINVVDTADVYSQGENEQIVGKALRGRRDEVVLASKFHGQIGTDPNHRGNSRRWIIRAVEDSLRRLDTDHLDLYQVHRPDPDVPLEETLRALDDLVRAGKIRYYGTTTFEPHQLVEAQWVATDRNLARPVTEQPPYSILARGAERATLPIAERHGLGVLTWSPLAGGWLSGRYRAGETAAESSRLTRQPHRHDPELVANQRKRAAAEELAKLADEAGLSLVHLSLAFVLQHPAVSTVIIGPRTLAHLETQLGAVDVRLSTEVLDRIDEIVAPGTTLSPADEGYLPPSLTDAATRRTTIGATR
ncbi:aldo/keto reductase [Nocardia alba]|uniref:Aryl-alcohol dehydrogenase-like predicted oxidoreductase n=1 Tax=Nocardia alba TaxID=225051 RepID=A0A4R1FKW3_9NOCA|nr:aldo/keto reductase [Nocardia alba]TCJ95606.1 aryl-alcohol dehydrogenase-like predicted oxidoreductase [Nocardia alba]